MIYHIFNYGVYAKQFYSFTYSNKVLCDIPQCFVLLNCKNLEVRTWNNVLLVSSFKNLFSLFYRLSEHDKVILHSYNHPYLYFLCFLFLKKIKVFSWSVWGSDLYFYRIKKTLKYKIYEFLRRKTIPHFAYLLTDIEGDYILAKEIYHIESDFISIGYPFLGIRSIPMKTVEKPIGEISFLLGNSADYSNKHIEMLDALIPYRKMNIKIYMPLSYGGNIAYIKEIVQQGKYLFGNKFIPLLDFIPYNDYVNLLCKIDVMLSIQERQQAVGNIWIVLSNGGKVYLNSNVTTVATLKRDGIRVFDYKDFKNKSLEEIVSMPYDSRLENNKKIGSLYSEEAMCLKWLSFYTKLQ